MLKPPKSKPKPWMYVVAYVIGAPFILLGTFLCALIIGIPLGLIVIVIGSLPAYHVHAKSLAWQMRDQPLDAENEKPWE